MAHIAESHNSFSSVSDQEKLLADTADVQQPSSGWPRRLGLAALAVAMILGTTAAVASLVEKEAPQQAKADMAIQRYDCEWVQYQDDCNNIDQVACECRRLWCEGNGDRGHGKCSASGHNPCTKNGYCR